VILPPLVFPVLMLKGGAWDGELESNTLLFELSRNWRGLLIEPNKQNFVNLVSMLQNFFVCNLFIFVIS